MVIIILLPKYSLQLITTGYILAMVLGLLSDTHDSLKVALLAFDFFKKNQVEVIVHAGDWTTPNSLHLLEDKARSLGLPFKGVLGNNDLELKTINEELVNFPAWVEIPGHEVLEINADGKKIAVYHGQDKIILDALINAQTYDALIKGHSHRIEHWLSGKTYVINPGAAAVSLPRKKDLPPSICIFDTSTWNRSFYGFFKNSFTQLEENLVEK